MCNFPILPYLVHKPFFSPHFAILLQLALPHCHKRDRKQRAKAKIYANVIFLNHFIKNIHGFSSAF